MRAKTLGQRVRRLRLKVADLSARDLSELIGKSHAVVGYIEADQHGVPTGTTLTGLARALGATIDWLLHGGEGEPTKEQVETAIAAARVALERKSRATKTEAPGGAAA